VRISEIVSVAATGLLLAGASGCGGDSKYVPVSGLVTLNGKPYPKAVVVFQPVATPDNANPGRGSSAFTDENGRFVLKTDNGQTGAVVGRHRVRIQTRRDLPMTGEDSKTGSPDDIPLQQLRRTVDPIPQEWYGSNSEKYFDVPPGGTDQANFAIETKKK
jgi:hypothetical protein